MIFNYYTLSLWTLHFISGLALIFQIFTGTANDWLITLLVYSVVAICLTMTYHRFLAHKSFEFKYDWIRKLCVSVCTIGSGFSSPIVWVAIHREHHRFSDTERDPHLGSKIGNILKLHFTSMFISPNIKYSVDLLKDPFYVFLHNNYFKLHLLWALLLAMIDPMLVISAYLVPVCLLWHAGNLVNSTSHCLGYRNYETRDQSRNNWVVALAFFGEWHNNHHNQPRNAKHGEKWWEIDIGYYFIKLLGKNQV